MDAWPLPQPDSDGDKEDRGRVLVVAGAPQMPGAAILAATAALRAGAGKLQIATARSVAQAVGCAVPEALVIGLPETKQGGIAPSAADILIERAERVDALLVGPGMMDEEAAAALMIRLLAGIERPVVVLDATVFPGIAARPESLHRLKGRVILTPHAGEMAMMLGLEKAAILSDPLPVAREAAERFQAVMVLKGAVTYIVAPGGEACCNRSGNVGLATSGSGDTLSGIVAGLAARGADPLQAASWAVYLHGCAGDVLARKLGPLGYLPRELLLEIPALMAARVPKS